MNQNLVLANIILITYCYSCKSQGRSDDHSSVKGDTKDISGISGKSICVKEYRTISPALKIQIV